MGNVCCCGRGWSNRRNVCRARHATALPSLAVVHGVTPRGRASWTCPLQRCCRPRHSCWTSIDLTDLTLCLVCTTLHKHNCLQTLMTSPSLRCGRG